MKKSFFSIVFLLSEVMLWGQTVQTYNVDSLRRALSRPQHDTARIWTLNNLGRNLSNSDSVLLVAQQAVALSRKIGFVKGEEVVAFLVKPESEVVESFGLAFYKTDFARKGDGLLGEEQDGVGVG